MNWNEHEQALPHIQHGIVDALQTLRERPLSSLTLRDYRAAFDAVSALTTPSPEVTSELFTLNGLSAEWIIPPLSIPEQVILYFHSGTYVNGTLQTDRALISTLAGLTRMKVLQIAYRVAPEYPFPTAVFDGLMAYTWLLAQGYAPHHIALLGSAAGGGLTLATLLLARDQGIPLPVIAACISPWIDLTSEGLYAKSNSTADILLTPSLLAYAAKQYIRPEQAALPLASPLYADLHGLPPLFLLVGEQEILHHDAGRLVERVKACKGKIQCVTWKDMFHVWPLFANTLPEGRLALEQIAAYFEKYFARAKGLWPE